MYEGPEVPSSQPREASSKPKTQPEESNLQNKQESREKRSPVEVVAECPRFRRQMLFARPFTVYGDVMDAAQQMNGKQDKEVPAIHFVIDTTEDGSRLCVGDEEGKKLGWINRDDNAGYEWNIRSVWRPGPKTLAAGHIPIHVRPERVAGGLDMPVNDKTILPLLETKEDQAGDVWYKVGSSLGGDGAASNIRNPVWIPRNNEKGLPLAAGDGTPNFLATKLQITNFERSLRLVLDELKNDPGKRTSDLHIDGLRIAYIRLLGGKGTAILADEDLQRIRDFLANHNAANEILIRDAQDRPYQYIDNFKNVLRYFQARLNAIERGDPRDSAPSMRINGKTEKLYPCFIF